ncbi:flagellar biosynthesis regulator FlaF [Plastorhodobacter daqingensis]|uniref:Flagellar biosynthesis regulator FlaF n=1 Tax=Plastorhodobacter daqingensis TaxID=1387281 RepID=A0ABW2UDH6_9RHOB
MNALQMATSAYSGRKAPVRTNRGTEYEVFARVTQKMRAALAEGTLGFPKLAAALHDNRQLWTLLAADVADPENALPQRLRAQIFYLAEFTGLHSAKVLAGKASAEALVEINTAVMRGLRSEGSAT